ncbi:hypothetical protein [Paracraurococcus ruber]|uniref:hypothetical protein n=1 Tax=Paracraurococcus ruber TaxID=77675 RepID=UPI0013053DEA|nr:hypothetical protein [Paracraurococcus ruber]
MSGPQLEGRLDGVALHPDLLEMEPRQRLPWPSAVLVIALLSLVSWIAIGGGVALLFR